MIDIKRPMGPKAADVYAKSDRCPPRTKAADVKHFYFEFLGESGRCTLTLVPYPNSKVNTSAAFHVNVFTDQKWPMFDFYPDIMSQNRSNFEHRPFSISIYDSLFMSKNHV